MVRIGEYLTGGQSMDTYIPIEKRVIPQRTTHDAELRRSEIVQYIREHEGELLNQSELAEKMEVTSATIGNHLRRLVAEGRLKRNKRTYWTRQHSFLPSPPRGNGPVAIKQPPAPVTNPELRKTDREAWDYVKTLKDLPSAELGEQMKGILGLLDHMRGKSPEVTLAPAIEAEA